MNIYIHIPFCVHRCQYCTFYALAQTPDREMQVAYTSRLIEQLRDIHDRYGCRQAPVSAVFFGGGTPSLFEPDQLLRILTAIEDLFDLSYQAEITLEANPETLSKERLGHLRSIGINRLSMGVQSLDDRFLKQLGRLHDSARVYQAVRWAREALFDNISVDLMWGFRGQETRDVARDIQAFQSLETEHISAYQLTHDMKRANELRYEVDDLVAEAMWDVVIDGLVKGGFHHYEIANFAQPHRECQHNLGYWHYDDYIGVGTSAVGTLASRDTKADCYGHRLTTIRDIHRYLAGDWGYEIEVLSPATARLEMAMMNLRLAEGLSLDRFEKRFGVSFIESFQGVADKWVADGYAAMGDGCVRLTDAGRRISNTLLADLVMRDPLS